jgi:hypothetical protein
LLGKQGVVMRTRNFTKGYVGLSFYLWAFTLIIVLLLVDYMESVYEKIYIPHNHDWICDRNFFPLTTEEAKHASRERITIDARISAYDVSVRLNTANKDFVDVFYQKALSLMTPSFAQSQKEALEKRSKLLKATNIIIADNTTIKELKNNEIPQEIRKPTVQEGEYYLELKGVLTVYKDKDLTVYNNDPTYKRIASIPFCQYMHLVPVDRTSEHPYGFLVDDIFEKREDRVLERYLYNYSYGNE